MSRKVGFSFVKMTELAANPDIVFQPNPIIWSQDLTEALRACNEGIRWAACEFPQTRYTIASAAVLYNENGTILGAYIPSAAEMHRIDNDIKPGLAGITDGTYIPNSKRNDSFIDRVKSAIDGCDKQFFQNATYAQPAILDVKDKDGSPIVFEHYGATRFDPSKVTMEVCPQLKPAGFWACPRGIDNWSVFQMNSIWKTNRIDFMLKDDARILDIETLDDIRYLQQHYPSPWDAPNEVWYPEGIYDYQNLPRIGIDWAAVSADYDGIYYNYHALGNAFGPFDVTSISVFNPDAIDIIHSPDIIQFPKPDDTRVVGMLSDGEKDEEEYYGALLWTAQFMLQHSDASDTARQLFYSELKRFAEQSLQDIENGDTPILEDPDVIAALNDLADNVQNILPLWEHDECDDIADDGYPGEEEW